MGYWFEVWTLPSSASFVRKIGYLPVIDDSWSFSDEIDKTRARGVVSVPASYDRLNEILYVDDSDHTNDVGAMIRVFRRTSPAAATPSPVFEFYVEEREDVLVNKAVGQVVLSGREITAAALDRVVLLPFDFPPPPSRHINHQYGADNILRDPGFEEPEKTNEVTRIHFTGVTGGTWTITVNSLVTANIVWNPSRTAIETAVEDLSNVVDVDVQGDGTVTNPWEISFVDPGGVDLVVSANGAGLTGPAPVLTLFQHVQGGVLRSPFWEKSRNPVTGVLHGEFTTFQVSTINPDTGTYAMLMNAANTSDNDYPGIQQTVRVEPGVTYRAGVRVRPAVVADLWRLVIRDTLDSYDPISTSLPYSGSSFPLGQYSNLDTPIIGGRGFLMWNTVEEVIFRFAYVGGGDAGDVKIDNAYLAPGQPAATLGAIWLDLLNDCRVDHITQRPVVLGWVTPTFTALVDSDGVAWPEPLAIELNVDATYLEIAMDFFSRWEYEHRFRWDVGANAYKFDAFVPRGMGTNFVGSTHPAINLGQNVLTAPMVMRMPKASWVIGHAADKSWIIKENVTLKSKFGSMESGLRTGGVASTSLQALLNTNETDTLAQMFGTEFTMGDDDNQQVVPIRDFRAGDTVTTNLGNRAAKFGRRVESIVVHGGKGGRAKTIGVHTSSIVYASSGVAGVVEGVRRLLRRPALVAT